MRSNVVRTVSLLVACTPVFGGCDSPDHGPDLGSSTFEVTFPADVAWMPLLQAGQGIGDVSTDGQNGGREIIGSAASPAIFFVIDGSSFFLRFRLSASPLQGVDNLRQFGWGVLIDTDTPAGSNVVDDYEYAIFADGVRDELLFEQNTTQGTLGSPNDTAELDLYVEPIDTDPGGNVRVTAVTADEFFLDLAIPLHAPQPVPCVPTAASPCPKQSILDVLTLDSTVRFIGGTSSNGRSLSVDLAGATGGATLSQASADPVQLDGGRPDPDADGVFNAVDIDDDNDGLPDVFENELGIDPDGDADDDGIANWRDRSNQGNATPSTCADADGNDICDATSSVFDTDGDGVPDHRDLDADGDGIADVVEAGHGAADVNADGMVDGAVGANGFRDALEVGAESGFLTYVPLDTDDDGVEDVRDLDADGDGLRDVSEAGAGALDANDDGRVDGPVGNDRDGIVDAVDADDAMFGFPSIDPRPVDADGDGIPSWVDPVTGATPLGGDSDADGVPDATECPLGWVCPDGDGDGTPDYMENPGLDLDGDGVPNPQDAAPMNPNVCRDVDTDTCDDCTNTGANGSGGSTANDGPDADGDGRCNAGDPDDDNDGVPDAMDAAPLDPNTCRDADTDACDDCTNTGANGSGGSTANDGPDVDGDGRCNAGDTDDDNDGVPDAMDAAPLDPNVCRDTDADTCDDCSITGANGSGGDPANDGLDANGNGICDAGEGDPDLDDDGVPNAQDVAPTDPNRCRDVDADTCDDCSVTGANGSGGDPANDGPDANGNGICDAGEGNPDVDGDGVPNGQDANPNNPNVCRDLDTDGCDDCSVTGANGSGGNLANDGPDLDTDGQCDAGDTDDDGDGVADATDAFPRDPMRCRDVDMDTCDDCSVTGADGSGGDITNDGTDSDGDGTCDAGELDLDSDDDGVSDVYDLDDDNDGIRDADEDGAAGGPDSDGDGTPNRLDLDSDDDGIYDLHEAAGGRVDGNGDGRLEGAVGANGIVDAVESSPDSGQTALPVDTDGDGAQDFVDVDADGDTILDEVEAGDDDRATVPVDTDGDGDPDFQDLDSDGDGLDDADEAGDDEPSTPPTDTDGDDEPDFRDTDSDNDGIMDERDVCVVTADPAQRDLDLDGVGDACQPTTLGVAGGGCSTAGDRTGTGAFALLLVAGMVATRRRRRNLALAATFAMASLTSPVSAQSLSAEYPVERLRLAVTSRGILDVEGARVLEHLAIDAAVAINLSDDPLTVYRGTGGDRMRVASLVSRRVGGELNGAVGLGGRFELGLSVPLILSQREDAAGLMASLGSTTGLGDLRVSGKAQLVRGALDVAFVLGMTLPTSSADDYFGDAGVVAEPTIALARRLGAHVRAGLNLGYRARSRTTSLDLVVDDEVMAGLGLAVGTGPVEIAVTGAIATAASDVLGAFNRNYAELKVGGSYDVPGPLVVFVGGGTGLAEGWGTPDWRVLGGLRFQRPAAAATPPPPARVEVVDRDPDHDGVIDPTDACGRDPETVNGYEDGDGCPDEWPDSDGDGLTDDRDKCPQEPETVDGFEDQDGCPDLDDDRDGVEDTADVCPREAGLVTNRGCPDPDRDADTVVDRLDNCPDEPGDPANQGCKAKQLVKITDQRLEILENVFFQTNQAVIERRSYPLLENVATVLKGQPAIRVRVEGHTDDRGNDAYNKKLSQRRADAVAKFLVGRGIDNGRLEAVGFGEEQPLGDNTTPEGRATNRRVVFTIIEGGANVKTKTGTPDASTID